MKYITLVLSLFLVSFAFARDLPPQLPVGLQAPEFALVNTVDGKTVKLADFKGEGKGVCVIFSCNHCPVVKDYEERMIALGNEFQKQGVPFLLISSNDTADYPQDGPAAMKERAAEMKYPFPFLYDPTQETGLAYGARVTPHVYLLDKDLKLVYRGAIDDNQNADKVKERYLYSALTALVKGKPGHIAVTETVAKGCSIKWRD